MFRRRPLMRAAVVGGGAYLAGKHVANRQADEAAAEDEQNQRISDLEAQQAPPDQQYQQQAPPQYQQASPQYQQAPPAPAAPQTSSMIDQLNQLADLHQKGVLSDDEFAAAKSKLLGS
jgi:Short C-terminal domain